MFLAETPRIGGEGGIICLRVWVLGVGLVICRRGWDCLLSFLGSVFYSFFGFFNPLFSLWVWTYSFVYPGWFVNT